MKVIQINATCTGGSTGRTCQELNDALLQLGHKGLVLYGNGSSKYEYARKVSGRGEVKFHGLMSRIFGKNAAYSPVATGKILKTLRAYQPDVVHLRNLHGNYVNLKPLLRYLAKNDIPTVVTLHDCWFFTGKCTHYTERGCYKWQTGCHNCPKLKSDIPSFYFDRTEQMWTEKKKLFGAIPRLAVIGVSDWITGEGKASFLNEAKIIERIYNWIDLEVFYPHRMEHREKFGISKDKFAVLCIGAGWNEGTSKAKDLLALAEKLPENYEIVLAGTVSFAGRLPKNIKYVGYVSSTEELAQLYSVCDAYVHLSREDTFGKVIAEALACGTPVVVYNSTACPELVGENCGYVVEPGDLDGILKALDTIAKQGGEKPVQACVDFAKSNFSKDRLIAKTLELYTRLIDCREEG